MENRRLPVPDNKDYGYALDQAFQIASERLLKITDLEGQCRKTGSRCVIKDSQKEVSIRYLNRSYKISLPDIKISLVDSNEEVLLREKVLILHYFTLAKGTPAAGKLITFRELPEGVVYFPTFSKRTIKPLTDNFSKDPNLLLKVAEKLGGRKTDLPGDMSVVIDAFPRVPITLVLWRGDEEFPAQGSVLFDAAITDYLPTEGITVLCEILAWKLVRLLKES